MHIEERELPADRIIIIYVKIYVQCYSFLLLYNIQKLNKILLNVLTSVFTKAFFAEGCMHGSNDDNFVLSTNRKQLIRKQIISKIYSIFN